MCPLIQAVRASLVVVHRRIGSRVGTLYVMRTLYSAVRCCMQWCVLQYTFVLSSFMMYSRELAVPVKVKRPCSCSVLVRLCIGHVLSPAFNFQNHT